MSDEEEIAAPTVQSRLFPLVLYHILPKLLGALEITYKPKGEEEQSPEFPECPEKTLSIINGSLTGLPLSVAFFRHALVEWEHSTMPKASQQLCFKVIVLDTRGRSDR